MKTKLAIALVPMSLLLVGCQPQAEKINTTGYASFGAPVSPDAPLTLAEVVKTADTLGEKRICIKADIAEVCQNRGCWMVLADKNSNVRVRFTASDTCADGYFVPRNAVGHNAYLLGKVMCTEISESDARHYAEDAGRTKDEIAKIVGPQQEVTILAEGVMISDGDKLDEPAK